MGAATDYGLLLAARFREELRRERSKYAAMRVALRQSWEPIVASGATVILGVLCLLLSELGGNRGMGPISAVSVTFAVIATLTFLPAALVLLGRGAFWPFLPHYGSEPKKGRGWPWVAALVGRRPRRVLVLSVGALVAAAVFPPTYDADGIPVTDAIQGRVERRRRAGGAGSPLRRRYGQPDGDRHARGQLARGRRDRRGHRRRRRGPPLHRWTTGSRGAAGRRRRAGAAGRDVLGRTDSVAAIERP